MSVQKKEMGLLEKKIKMGCFWEKGELTLPDESNPVFDLKIGFIGGQTLFTSLKYEADIFLLTEDNCKATLSHIQLDYILIESCFDTVTGDWRNFYSPKGSGNNSISSLISLARSLDVPVIYYFSLDYEYFSIFSQFATKADHVLCADQQAVEGFSLLKIEAHYFPPAVQPKIFNPLINSDTSGEKKFYIVCDGLADILSHEKEYQPVLERFSNYDFKLYDSLNTIWESKVTPLGTYRSHILGSVSFLSKVALLKSSEIFVSLTPSDRTETNRVALAMEAAACRLPVIHFGTMAQADICKKIILSHATEDDFFVELVRMEQDPLYKERIAHKAWRYVMENHTWSHRLDVLNQLLKLDVQWEPYPKCSLITPTIRPEFIPRTVAQFEQLSYPNKELVVVFNGKMDEYLRFKNKYQKRTDIQIHYMPKEKHAGACMNLGIQHAKGDYVFRFDDDDFYGPHYILDYVLYNRCTNADIFGKPAQYWFLDDDPICNFRKIPHSRYLTVFSSRHLDHDDIPISGNSIGGKKEIFLVEQFPDTYGAADSAFQLTVQEKEYRCMTTDRLNMAFCRRSDGSHTWHWNDRIRKRSEKTYFLIEDIYC